MKLTEFFNADVRSSEDVVLNAAQKMARKIDLLEEHQEELQDEIKKLKAMLECFRGKVSLYVRESFKAIHTDSIYNDGEGFDALVEYFGLKDDEEETE